MLSIKTHESYRKVVAVCDADLLGKKFEDEKRQLDLRENFYKGEEVDEEKAAEILIKHSLDDATFNIVGEKAVGVAVKAGIVDKEGVGEIDGVKFALVF